MGYLGARSPLCGMRRGDGSDPTSPPLQSTSTPISTCSRLPRSIIFKLALALPSLSTPTSAASPSTEDRDACLTLTSTESEHLELLDHVLAEALTCSPYSTVTRLSFPRPRTEPQRPSPSCTSTTSLGSSTSTVRICLYLAASCKLTFRSVFQDASCVSRPSQFEPVYVFCLYHPVTFIQNTD